MPAAKNIILVGFMGTGKTSVGKSVAQRLHMQFVDMDEVIEQREGRPITRIFAEDGEPRFRTLERELVRELAARNGLVIGAGGGLVLNPENIADFERTGTVVCLSATPETILARVQHETQRPLLAGDGKLDRITALLATRQPLYDAIACQIDTNGKSVEDVVDQVVSACSTP